MKVFIYQILIASTAMITAMPSSTDASARAASINSNSCNQHQEDIRDYNECKSGVKSNDLNCTAADAIWEVYQATCVGDESPSCDELRNAAFSFAQMCADQILDICGANPAYAIKTHCKEFGPQTPTSGFGTSFNY